MSSVDSIMQEFPFHRVLAFMTLTDWKWGAGKDAKVPSMDELKSTALRLLESVSAGKCISNETGGFRAVCHKDDECPTLELLFLLARTEMVC